MPCSGYTFIEEIVVLLFRVLKQKAVSFLPEIPFKTPDSKFIFPPSDVLSEIVSNLLLASSRLIKAYSAPDAVQMHGVTPFRGNYHFSNPHPSFFNLNLYF